MSDQTVINTTPEPSTPNRRGLWIALAILAIAIIAVAAWLIFFRPATAIVPAAPAANGSAPAVADSPVTPGQYAKVITPITDDDCGRFWNNVAPEGTTCVVRQTLTTDSDVIVNGVLDSNPGVPLHLRVGDKIECPYGCSFYSPAQ